MTLLLLALFVAPGTACSQTDAELRLLAGAAWNAPTGGSIGDAYEGGPLGTIGLTLRGTSAFAGSLRTGFFQTTARPSHPVFVGSVESRLRWIPVAVEGRYRILDRLRSPYVSLGVDLWILSESFDYRLAGEDRSADGNRTQLGGSLGLGYELRDLGVPVRLGARIGFASLERRRLTADGSVFETGESEVSTFFSIGVEVEP